MSGFVRAENISFSFKDGAPLLRNFSLNLQRGHCGGITGPSGCGKSTLALILAGHLRPQSGSVWIDGSDVTARPGRDVFLVAQDSDLFPWQTVEAQIAFGMKSPDPQRVRELIEMTKLKGFEKFYPRQLSGGMKKRLSIARALAVDPKLLIFDESFSALDFDLRQALFADLKEIWKRTQTTILLITHDPRDLHQIAQSEIRL